MRTLILVVASIEYAAQVYRWRISERGWGRVATGVVGLVAILAIVGGILGFQAYTQSRYEASPHKEAMDLLTEQAEPGASLVTDDQFVYEQLYPFLRKRFRVRLVETHSYLPPWEPRLAETVSPSSGQLWIYAAADSPLHEWPAERYSPITSHEFDGWRLSGWELR